MALDYYISQCCFSTEWDTTLGGCKKETAAIYNQPTSDQF